MTYDDWKTTNPADRELGPDPDDEFEDEGEPRTLEDLIEEDEVIFPRTPGLKAAIAALNHACAKYPPRHLPRHRLPSVAETLAAMDRAGL